MSARHAVIAALVTASLVACDTIGPLPVPGSPGKDAAWSSLQEVSADRPLRSTLLDPRRMSQVARRLMGDCNRARMLRSSARDVVAGYRSGEAAPAVAVSLSRIGSGEAEIVLAVGLRDDGGRRQVSDVLTFISGSDLYGMPAYEQGRDRFLGEFSGRAPEDDFGDIDAVTGATAISKALREAIRAEARLLDALLADEAHRLTER